MSIRPPDRSRITAPGAVPRQVGAVRATLVVALVAAVLVAVALASRAALLAQAHPTDVSNPRPFIELYLPALVRTSPYPYATATPTPPGPQPTATATRRPTITATATPTLTQVRPTPTATTTAPAESGTSAPTRPATVTPTATPQGSVVVTSFSEFQHPAGTKTYLYVVGEIRNTSASNISQPVVVVHLLDETNLTITVVEADVFAAGLRPNEAAPFRLVVEPPAGYDHAQPAVSTWRWTDQAPLPALAPPVDTAQVGGVEAQLLGRLVNTTGTPIRRVRVVATLRGADGRVANVVDSGIGVASPFGIRLDPDVATPFRIPIPGPATGSPDFRVLYEPALAPALAPLVPDRLRLWHSPGRSDVFGEVENTTNTPIREVQVVATFYDASHHIVGADWEWAGQNADRIVNQGVRTPFQVFHLGAGAPEGALPDLQVFYSSAEARLPEGVIIQDPAVQVSTDYLSLTLRGTIVNRASVPLRNPRLVVTFYKDELVHYALSTDVPSNQPIGVGASTPFIITQPLPVGIGQDLANTTPEYAIDFQP